MSQISPVLEVRNITKTYGGVKALDSVSMSLVEGHVHCLAGENGCGKSTLIKIISGVERPDSGEIVIDGIVQDALNPVDSILAGIQVIYQDFSLFPNLSVAENMSITSQVARKTRFYSAKDALLAAQNIVSELGLSLDLDELVENLSVADKQLTAICRALVNDARIIIMDEPTTALTQTEVRFLFRLVDKLRERGVALVFVSHKLEEALEVSQDITILRNGQHIISGPASEFDRKALVQHITGREVREIREVVEPDYSATPLLKVDSLGLPGAFSDVSFTVQPGEIVGIAGLLGSGRTEIVEAVFGVRPAKSGRIEVDGKPVKIRSIKDALRAGIGYLPEDRLSQGLFLDRSVGENLIASSLDSHRGKAVLLDYARIKQTVRDMFERLRVKAASTDAKVRSLSGGNAQRVVIGKLLATKPKLLILNGPTVGVDIGSKEQILGILRQEAAAGMGIIVISDDAPELMSVCNRVLFVKKGRIVDEVAGSDISVDLIQERTAA
jgi:simple sugar transport system ATP-binding protein